MEPTQAHQKIRDMTWQQDNPGIRDMAHVLNSGHKSMDKKVLEWYKALGISIPTHPTSLSFINRKYSNEILLEKVLDVIKSSGFKLVHRDTREDITVLVELDKGPASGNDLVSISTHLAEIIIAALGQAIKQGLPICAVFNEIMFSHGTKILEENILQLIHRVDLPISSDDDVFIISNTSSSISPKTEVLVIPETYIKPDVSTIIDWAKSHGSNTL